MTKDEGGSIILRPPSSILRLSSLVLSSSLHSRNPRSRPEIPRLPLFVGAQDQARDAHPMHLVGAVVDAGEAGVPVHALERGVGADALGAEDLDGAIDRVMQHLRPDDLDEA